LSLLAIVLRSTGQRTLLRNIAALGNTRTVDYWRLCDRLLRYRLDFAAAMAAAPGGGLDCILGPACALPAFPHGASTELGTAGVNTLLYNLLGYPAGVVPVTRVCAGEETERPPSRDIVERMARNCELDSTGLPVGVQIAAAPWQEHVALAAMRAVEVAARRSEGFPHSSKLPA
jgi:fatty acid amide hydrolase